MPLTLDQIRTFYDQPNLQVMLDDLVKKGYLKFEHPKKVIHNRREPDLSKPKGYNIVAGNYRLSLPKY